MYRGHDAIRGRMTWDRLDVFRRLRRIESPVGGHRHFPHWPVKAPVCRLAREDIPLPDKLLR